MTDYTDIVNAIQSGDTEQADTSVRTDLESRALDYLAKYNPATELSKQEIDPDLGVPDQETGE